jgi:5-methylcytosine-specific restriction protein A
MPNRPCLDCGHITNAGPRCLNCRRARDRQREQHRPTPAQRGYDSTWTKLATDIKTAWIAEHGLTCPGFGMAPHPIGDPSINPLTVDHVIPKIQGGTDDRSNLAVLCKRCQGRKGRTERGGTG